MRIGDRLIEVNSINVENHTNENIFHRIKTSSAKHLQMLVVDHKTFLHCKRHQVDVKSLPVIFKSDQGQPLEATDNLVAENQKGLMFSRYVLFIINYAFLHTVNNNF